MLDRRETLQISKDGHLTAILLTKGDAIGQSVSSSASFPPVLASLFTTSPLSQLLKLTPSSFSDPGRFWCRDDELHSRRWIPELFDGEKNPSFLPSSGFCSVLPASLSIFKPDSPTRPSLFVSSASSLGSSTLTVPRRLHWERCEEGEIKGDPALSCK